MGGRCVGAFALAFPFGFWPPGASSSSLGAGTEHFTGVTLKKQKGLARSAADAAGSALLAGASAAPP